MINELPEGYRRLTDEEKSQLQWARTEAMRRGLPKDQLLFLSYDLLVAAVVADEHCYFGSEDGGTPSQDVSGGGGQFVFTDTEVEAAALSAHPGIITGVTIFGHGVGSSGNSSTNVIGQARRCQA
jgi:hypothetical protein